MKFIDLTGRKFGKLVVIKRATNTKDNKARWLCKCNCGNKKIIRSACLMSGNTKGCGCTIFKHGHAPYKRTSRTYTSWHQMLQRCNNCNNQAYKHYGGRGIEVCKRWLKFKNFLEDMGERPKNKTLDRINNNKGYYKKNCRWATNKQQHRNTRITCFIKYNDKLKSRIELAEEYKIHPDTLRRRLKRGLSIEKALLLPVK